MTMHRTFWNDDEFCSILLLTLGKEISQTLLPLYTPPSINHPQSHHSQTTQSLPSPTHQTTGPPEQVVTHQKMTGSHLYTHTTTNQSFSITSQPDHPIMSCTRTLDHQAQMSRSAGCSSQDDWITPVHTPIHQHHHITARSPNHIPH
jgi:hypothetical protein